jgi:hypothetical protein
MSSPAVVWIWGITLALVTLVVVPLALYLLHRTLRAAMSIERYTREALEAGAGIAANTAAIAALEETIGRASALLKTTQQLKAATAGITQAVRRSKEG